MLGLTTAGIAAWVAAGAVVLAAAAFGRRLLPETAAKVVLPAAIVLVSLVEVTVVFEANLRTYTNGASIGALYGLLAVGLILIYRSNRIINFAAAAIGAVPAIGMALLQVNKGWPFLITFPLCLILSGAAGGLVEFGVIRRFATAPRLILTVATIGVAQGLALLGVYVRDWIGRADKVDYLLPTPWEGWLRVRVDGQLVLTGNQLASVVLVAGSTLALGVFFRRSRLGIGVRASAENADRAGLIGIPVKLVGTLAWVIAGSFAGLCIFLRSSLVGVPLDGSLGYSILVYALAAATIARMENIPVALAAGMGVGLLEQASTEKTGSGDLATALMLLVILVALLGQQKKGGRAADVGTLTFQTVKEFRPVPSELRNDPAVRTAKLALIGLVTAVALAAPFLVGGPRVGKLTLVPIYAMVAVSLVILTGWAGQISLGQFAIVGIGGAVAGSLAQRYDVDFFLTLIAGVVVGAIVAVLVGLPALRVPGLYLAVTTMAFAGATEGYILRPDQPIGKAILPEENSRIGFPLLYERIDTAQPRTFYFLCVLGLTLALMAARAFRRNRSGRVLIAVRDNQRAAPAYGINLSRTKLAAFAVAGGIASASGVLLAYQQQTIEYRAYGISPSIFVFVVAVVGGITSLPGAVLGAVLFQSLYLFGSERLALFSTSVGLLVILLFLPGGLAEAMYRIRDEALRRLADRRGILVPSLVADKRVDEQLREAEAAVIEAAEQHVEEVGSFEDIHHRLVRCPVCGVHLSPDEAPDHDHLRPDAAPAATETDLEPVR